jgi:hypothetical protein
MQLTFLGNQCVYTGYNTEFLVDNLQPFTCYSFRLQFIIIDNGEKSPMSDKSDATTDESTPSVPINLKISGITTSVIKIVWEPPEDMNGILKSYHVYKDNVNIDTTTETNFIFGGLHPGTSYEFQVCASTIKGKGKKSSIKASTCEIGDITPDKPIFGLIGRREILGLFRIFFH